LLSTWLLCASLSGGLPEGRKVGFAYFFKVFSEAGARHMNIDYSVCNALQHRTEGMTASLVCYDIGCQWSINFLNRVKKSDHLSLPPGLDIISAVGKFHLGAHIPECFALYSLNFVDGAGQQDGEIIETLWSDTNRFSGSLRAMSKAHRHEVLDDIMRDSNWKKMVNMGKSQLSTQTLA
jgi:Kyakuja-Dileera-Zisupton transposase